MTGFATGPVLILALIATYGAAATSWLMIPGLVLAVLIWKLLPDYEPHADRGTVPIFGKHAVTRHTLALTLVMALAGLGFLTFTSTVPLWLVDEHHLTVDAPFLGWTLASGALAAGLGAIAGGAIGPRLGYATTSAGSLAATGGAFAVLLLSPAGAPMLLAAAAIGLLLYMSQPLLILAAQNAAPRAPTAGAGLVFGGGSGLAGLLYLASGPVQASLGLTTAILINAALLIPAALLAALVLRHPAARSDRVAPVPMSPQGDSCPQ